MASTASSSQPTAGRQQQSSHMLKTGRRGNPFCKMADTHDLFATLMVSLDLSDRTRFFRTYPNAFTTDDAATNLSSLRFSQSNRTSDPVDPQRIVTTTTTTTFSMSRDIAKGICQHFMDARLIENAADPSSLNFKDRGIYQITPKGLHILERFITKNGISADHLVPVFTSQPICMKLLHLERRTSDDEIHISRSVIDVVFRRFAGGRHPNYINEPHDPRPVVGSIVPRPFVDNARPPPGFDRAGGVELQDVTEKSKAGQPVVVKQVFLSTHGIDWLVDYSTCCCREEAGELMAHFVRYGLITLYLDRSKTGDRVTASEAKGTISGEAEYRQGAKILYRITDDGRRAAATPGPVSQPAAASSTHFIPLNEAAPPLSKPALLKVGSTKMEPKVSSEGKSDSDVDSQTDFDRVVDTTFVGGTGLSNVSESAFVGKKALADLFKSDTSDAAVAGWSKDQHSTTTRLRAILDEPALRALFRDFLRANYCDENLAFWIDVTDFRRRFSTTSSAVGGAAQQAAKRKQGAASNAMETHQQNLVAAALHIYHTYLAPLSPSELNIDHNLRADVVNYVNRALAEVAPPSNRPVTSSGSSGDDSDMIPALRATQVQTLLRQYERIQEHIFRLLATDQVPRFVRTEPFLALMEPEALKNDAPSSTTNSPDLSKPPLAASPALGAGPPVPPA
ncbi:BQ5605_C002g01449 [Microbotryum silenes-dioicae]|uniref:BQ5605_C002g01449 protein n=1 Tax=Microbotryum silenes-dioicae TaxID=796604 RepID=A0A2X0P1T6_9BASI|nr:BQ5605_C002g01449 [Microbotryum silenes-dioicae]